MEAEQQSKEWKKAVELLERWELGNEHLDDLLEKIRLDQLRWLVMESFRTRLVADRILETRLKRRPRSRIRQILHLALAECLYREEEKYPQIVNTAVSVGRQLGLSRPETGFINGVLRSILREPEVLQFSLDETHPAWMMERWRNQFGAEALALLLEWNFTIPGITIHGKTCPAYAEPTQWAGFFRIRKGCFKQALADLQAGGTYVQDPFTRIPVELLQVQPGETVLDLCAAPGGKSRMLLAALKGDGHLFAVDKPGPRLERLQENLAGMDLRNVSVTGADIRKLESSPGGNGPAPGSVDAVLIDVPCSNTGVIQKRPDVKFRLKEADIAQQAALQLELLESAANWVGAGGRLVYSTCSLEREENADVVTEFLERHGGWELKRTEISLPWMCGHDGGGAFLLTKLD